METQEITKQLEVVVGEIKSYKAKIAEEAKLNGEARAESKAMLEKLEKMQVQLDAQEQARVAGERAVADQRTLMDDIIESESLQKLLKDKQGTGRLEMKSYKPGGLKTVLVEGTAASFATTGVLPIDRIPGMTIEARQKLKIRALFTSRPTTQALVDFVKVTTAPTSASPTVEATTKPEGTAVFASQSERIRLIATTIPATKQILDDMEELQAYLLTALPYYVDLTEEKQVLSGDNIGEDLHGIIPQASAFLTGNLSTSKGWTFIDIVARAIQQIDAANEIPAEWIVLNTNDYWTLRLTKDSYGRYLLGDPMSPFPPKIWGLDMVYTSTIAQGTFLVGNGQQVSAEIRDRMATTIAISTEHQDFFVKNQVMIRAEKRMAMVTKRPNSFVTGTFSNSPA